MGEWFIFLIFNKASKLASILKYLDGEGEVALSEFFFSTLPFPPVQEMHGIELGGVIQKSCCMVVWIRVERSTISEVDTTKNR